MHRFYLLLPLFIFLSCKAQTQEQALANYEVKQINDLLYSEESSENEKHKLNLFLPQGVEEPPLLLWIHGGAWAFGDRYGETELAQRFAERGIAVAAMSYRLSSALWANPPKSDGAPHPAHIEDVAKAFSWIKDHATDYGYAADRLFVSGYSAGGHLSALLASDNRYLQAEGLTTSDIKAVIPIAGAYDMVDYYEVHKNANGKTFADQHVKAAFGETEAQLQDASVTNWISQVSTPMFIISESQTYDYTRVLEKKVKDENVKDIQFWHIRNEDHNSLMGSLKSQDSSYRDKIVAFILQMS